MFFIEYISSLFTFDCMCCKEMFRSPEIYDKKRKCKPIFRRIRKM